MLGHPSLRTLKILWGRPENVLGTAWISLPGASLERQIRTSPGRHFRASDWDVPWTSGWERFSLWLWKRRITTADEENPKIVPQTGEIDKIVSFFYHTYKGEGRRKMQPRIKRFCTGIIIKRIQSNETGLKTISKSIQYSVTSHHFLL